MLNKSIGLILSAALVAAFFYRNNPEEPPSNIQAVQRDAEGSSLNLSNDENQSQITAGSKVGKTTGELASLFKPRLAIPNDDFDDDDNFGDREQIIGEFEDPDSDVDDMLELRQQIIGEPLDVDLELESFEPSQIAIVENPFDQADEAELATQIIGESDDIDEISSVDDEIEQIIGQPEPIPDS